MAEKNEAAVELKTQGGGIKYVQSEMHFDNHSNNPVGEENLIAVTVSMEPSEGIDSRTQAQGLAFYI